MTDIIGWVASFMFALCALPQSIHCYKVGNSRGISSLFIWMWLIGEILMQYYVIMKHGFDMPLLVNYWINTVLILVILKYKYWERT